MLPWFAELGDSKDDDRMNTTTASNAFDEASYGVWNTIMEDAPDFAKPDEITSSNYETVKFDEQLPYQLCSKSEQMPQMRIDRLEEFASAFLGMSQFDIVDVWLPPSLEHVDALTNITNVFASSKQSNLMEEFRTISSQTLIKVWSGAVGRAFGSGNPVWSSNPVCL